MSTLRTQAIRLAHTSPDLRPHLLPMLKVAAPAYFMFAKAVRAYIKEAVDGPVSARVFESPTSVRVSFNIVGTQTRFSLTSAAELEFETEIERIAAHHGMRLVKKGSISKWLDWVFDLHGVKVEVDTNGTSMVQAENGDGTYRNERGVPVK